MLLITRSTSSNDKCHNTAGNQPKRVWNHSSEDVKDKKNLIYIKLWKSHCATCTKETNLLYNGGRGMRHVFLYCVSHVISRNEHRGQMWIYVKTELDKPAIISGTLLTEPQFSRKYVQLTFGLLWCRNCIYLYIFQTVKPLKKPHNICRPSNTFTYNTF